MKYKLVKLAFKVEDMANKESSEYLMSLCHSAYFHYIDDKVLVYAIVETDADLSVLSQYPVVDFNFEIVELKDFNKIMQTNLDILNGTIKPMELK